MKKYLIVLGLFFSISLSIHYCYNLRHQNEDANAKALSAESENAIQDGLNSTSESNIIGTDKVTVKQAKAPDHKHEYNDYFFATRSYPDEVFDFDAYRSAIITINDQIHNTSFKSMQTWNDEWRVEGPTNIGGRINALAIHPNTEDIIYAGSAWGGVFKTVDAGDNWEPIFDEQPFLSIATIEIDPSNPDRVYVGTGDVNISGYPAVGNGVYRSDDAGLTWAHLGLAETGIISKVKIDPNDPNTIYVGAMGFPFERDNNRGLYKSTDGGATWNQILFLSDEAGIIDLVMHPSDGDILYACGWNRIRNNTESTTWGDDGKIWKTIDGGSNWTILSNGLPQTPVSRIGIAMSPMDPNKLYSVITDTTHFIKGVYKSEDAGANWTALNIIDLENNTALGGFGWYFGKIAVNPGNDDEIYVLGVDLWKTSDGYYWELATPDWWYYDVHADKHVLETGPNGGFYLGTDGGIYKSTDYADSWEDIENLPNTQIYRVEASPHADQDGSYGIGCQDNGTTAGNYTDPNNWPRLRGGDGFQVRYHPTDDQIMYSETQNGNIDVSTDAGNSWSNFTSGIDGDDRRSWDMQYIISPHDPDVLYTGTFRMYKTDNGTNPDWETISESLSDSVTLADRYHIITTLDESPVVQGKLYAGTVDANVWTSPDDGMNWIDISNGLPVRYVTSVKASPTDGDAVYVTHSGYKDGDNISHIHFSSDNGMNWTDISGDLPDIAVNDIFVPTDQNDALLFIATDAGVYVSENSGTNWERVGTNMPIFQVYDLDVDYNNKRLAAATFARSLWTYDISDVLEDPQDTQAPIIVVNGSDTVFVDSNGNYDLPDVTAFDETDGDITDSISVDDSLVNPDVPGTYPVIYTVSDAAGNETTYTVYVVVLPVGIEEINQDEITLFPNPVEDLLSVKWNSTKVQASEFQILNSNGQVHKTGKLSSSIDVNELAKGFYILRIRTTSGKTIQKSFLKK